MNKLVPEHRVMTVKVNRRIFIAFVLVVGLGAGMNIWGTFANRNEAAKLREDRRILHRAEEKIDHTKEIAERADDQVRAVRDFSVCGFVLVLGLDLPQVEAERVIQKCVDIAKFPAGSTPPPAVIPRKNDL